MNKYSVAKHDGAWWVVDDEGYDVTYVSYDTKREATAAARALETERLSRLSDQEISDAACDRAAAKRHPMFRDRY